MDGWIGDERGRGVVGEEWRGEWRGVVLGGGGVEERGYIGRGSRE